MITYLWTIYIIIFISAVFQYLTTPHYGNPKIIFGTALLLFPSLARAEYFNGESVRYTKDHVQTAEFTINSQIQRERSAVNGFTTSWKVYTN